MEAAIVCFNAPSQQRKLLKKRTKRLGATCFGAEIKTEDLPNKKQIRVDLKDVSDSNG
jgi:hypothetical protein